MNSEQRFASIFAKRSGEIKPGLQRMIKAFAFLKQPGAHIPCVLVAGTNGKGSTCAYLTKMLEASGLKVGLYTSPHLIHFSERYAVTGMDIDDNAIEKVWRELEQTLPSQLYRELSFFEIATLIAFQIFHREATDFNVIEVGLGGRWDATNVTHPVCSLITSIGFDHEKFLGNTLSLIAEEKAGIMRAGQPVFFGASISAQANPEAYDALINSAKRWGALARVVEVPSTALYLEENFALAKAAYEWLMLNQFHKVPLNLGTNDRQRGAILPSLVGRDQQLDVFQNELLVRSLRIDVCHNIQGVQAFRKALAKRVGAVKLPAMISILSDKNVRDMLDLLQGFLGPIVLFKVKNERSIGQSGGAGLNLDQPLFEDFAGAFQHALMKWPKDTPWVVCGSLVAVGEVLDYFSAMPKQQQMGVPLAGRLPSHSDFGIRPSAAIDQFRNDTGRGERIF